MDPEIQIELFPALHPNANARERVADVVLWLLRSDEAGLLESVVARVQSKRVGFGREIAAGILHAFAVSEPARATLATAALVTDGQSAARELIKYMLKDITANGDKIPPDVFARVYEALAQRRMRQASKGFMGLAKRAKPCCECGAELPFRVRKEPKASAPKVATK